MSCVRTCNYCLFLTNIYIGIQEDFTAWWDGVRSRLFPMLRGALPLEGIYVNSSGDQSMTPEKNTDEVGQYSICMYVCSMQFGNTCRCHFEIALCNYSISLLQKYVHANLEIA